MRLNQNFQIVEVEGKRVYIQNKTDTSKQILCDVNNTSVERVAVLLYPNRSLSVEEIISQLREAIDASEIKEAIAKLESLGVMD